MSDNFVTLVSGLPRSGTSLMMQMLQAGGLELLTDGRREPDEHNPRGYFEHEAIKHGRNDLSWLEQANGKVSKVIYMLLLQLPEDRKYRIIFMLRDLEEVVVSQRVMLKQQGRAATTLTDEKLTAIFEKQLASVRHWLAERQNFLILYLNYRDVIANPSVVCEQINDFLGGNLTVASMAAAVDAQLYHQRELT